MVEEMLEGRVKELKGIAERLERISVELCRVNVANVELERLRFDLRGWLEQAEAEYANF